MTVIQINPQTMKGRLFLEINLKSSSVQNYMMFLQYNTQVYRSLTVQRCCLFPHEAGDMNSLHLSVEKLKGVRRML